MVACGAYGPVAAVKALLAQLWEGWGRGRTEAGAGRVGCTGCCVVWYTQHGTAGRSPQYRMTYSNVPLRAVPTPACLRPPIVVLLPIPLVPPQALQSARSLPAVIPAPPHPSHVLLANL